MGRNAGLFVGEAPTGFVAWSLRLRRTKNVPPKSSSTTAATVRPTQRPAPAVVPDAEGMETEMALGDMVGSDSDVERVGPRVGPAVVGAVVGIKVVGGVVGVDVVGRPVGAGVVGASVLYNAPKMRLRHVTTVDSSCIFDEMLHQDDTEQALALAKELVKRGHVGRKC